MKNYKYAILGLCLAVAGLTGCDKAPEPGKEPPVVEEGDVNVLIKSGAASSLTRTVIDGAPGSFSTKWEVGNAMGVYTSGSNTNKKFTIAEGGIADNVAVFSGSFTGVTGDITVYGYYPWNAYAGNNPQAVSCTIPAQQTMAGASYDPSADYMVAQSQTATVEGEDLTLENYRFRYVVSFLNLSMEISDTDPNEVTVPAGEKVLGVEIEASAEKALAGKFTLNLESGQSVLPAAAQGDNKIVLEVPADATVGTLSAWIVTKPFSIAETDEIKVTVTTENYIITKSIKGEATDFEAGKVKTLNLIVDSKATVADNEGPAPEAPAVLYIMGDATEFDAPKAMRKLDADNFEIYTKLEEGSYNFTDAADGTAKFTVKNDKLATGSAPITATEGIYLIKVDFGKLEVSLAEITSLKYHFPSNGGWEALLEYEGNGVWKLDNNYAYDSSKHDGDSRHRFNAVVGGKDWAWGYVNNDSTQPPTETSGDYYKIYPRLRHDDWWHWDYTFKYHSSADQRRVNLRVIMSPEVDHYYHTVELIPFEVTPASLTAPADGTEVDLNDRQNVDFSWEAGSSSDGEAVTYSVVFYKTGDSAEEIGRFEPGDEGKATSTSLSFDKLNRVALDAGIGTAATGEVYWTVVTKRAGTETAAASRNKLTLTRIDGIEVIPENVYITGTATEYTDVVANAGMMKKTAPGKFEIYTRLSAGSYYFTDATNGAGRKFVVDGTDLKEQDASMDIAAEKIYRISLDFYTSEASVQTVDDMQILVMYSQSRASLSYQGKGVWSLEHYEVIIPFASWGRYDSRYLFVFTIGGTQERWNRNHDNNGTPTIGQEGYGNLKFGTLGTGQWDGDDAPFSFPSEIVEGETGQFVDITLSLAPGDTYTHVLSNLQK